MCTKCEHLHNDNNNKCSLHLHTHTHTYICTSLFFSFSTLEDTTYPACKLSKKGQDPLYISLYCETVINMTHACTIMYAESDGR